MVTDAIAKNVVEALVIITKKTIDQQSTSPEENGEIKISPSVEDIIKTT